MCRHHHRSRSPKHVWKVTTGAPRRGRAVRCITILVAALSLIAAACGDGADTSPESPTASSTADAPEASQPDETGSPSTPTNGPADGTNTAEAPAATPTDRAEPTDTPTTEPDDPAARVRAGENVDWEELVEGLDAGSVKVPLDYRDPDAGELELALLVSRATSPQDRIGYLLVNPGGPGGSGLDMAGAAAAGYGFSPEIVERFDIVGFDPRGVGLSDPLFECGAPGEQLKILERVDPPYDTPEETAAGEAAVRLCAESMGPAAGLLHSEYVARDMDEIREALGAEQISYFGVSYGATLGVWYATLFPQRVKAMVVDAADNPVDDTSTQQARIDNFIEETSQFEARLGEALDACDDPTCPVYNDGDPRGYFIANAHRLAEVAPAANGNPLSGIFAVVSTLYTEQTWPDLWEGFGALVERDDPTILADYARFQLGESSGGTTFTEHVNCLDSWVLYPHLDRETRFSDETAATEAYAEHLPLLYLIDPGAPQTCFFYDIFEPTALEGPLDGGDVPILVIGNRWDPATPFSESQELVQETLSNGHLLTVDHSAHVAYPDNDCAVAAVHAVLIAGDPPSSQAGDCTNN